MKDLRQITEEWRAWRRACEVLRELGVNINEEERLHAALVVWGEELVALRVQQTAEIRSKVLDEKRGIAARLLPDLAEVE